MSLKEQQPLLEAPSISHKQLEDKGLNAGLSCDPGRRLAVKPRPMNGLNGFLARLNGWALSLALHGGIALVAGLSVFGVHVSGGSGTGSGGVLRAGLSTPSFAATLRSAEDQVVSGATLGDPPQFGRLTSEQTPLEPIAEELPEPSIPFDVFAVGSSDPVPAVPLPLSDRAFPPSSQAEGRASQLPPTRARRGRKGKTRIRRCGWRVRSGGSGRIGGSGRRGPQLWKRIGRRQRQCHGNLYPGSRLPERSAAAEHRRDGPGRARHLRRRLLHGPPDRRKLGLHPPR